MEPDGIPRVTNQTKLVRVYSNVKELVEFFSQPAIKPKSFDKILGAIHTLPQHFLPEFHVCLCSSFCPFCLKILAVHDEVVSRPVVVADAGKLGIPA